MSTATGRWTAAGHAVLHGLQPIVVLAALLTVPLTIAEVNGQGGDAFQFADWVLWAVFAGEYALGLVLAQNRRRYLLTAWLSLLVVVVSFPLLPALFAVVRLARLARVLRLVRTIRSEVLDHIVVINERHLLSVLTEFADYYNHDRPNRSPDLHSPLPPAPLSDESLPCWLVLGGLHHVYARAA